MRSSKNHCYKTLLQSQLISINAELIIKRSETSILHGSENIVLVYMIDAEYCDIEKAHK